MSKGDKWRDDSHWGKTTSSGSGQKDYYVGSHEGGGEHCHGWNNKSTGSSGVVHRGECKVCGDAKGQSSSPSPKGK